MRVVSITNQGTMKVVKLEQVGIWDDMSQVANVPKEVMKHAGHSDQSVHGRRYVKTEDLIGAWYRGSKGTDPKKWAKKVLGDKGYGEAFLDFVTETGIPSPVSLAQTNRGKTLVTDGHHRLAAAILLDIDRIPVTVTSEPERRHQLSLKGGDVELPRGVKRITNREWHQRDDRRFGERSAFDFRTMRADIKALKEKMGLR